MSVNVKILYNDNNSSTNLEYIFEDITQCYETFFPNKSELILAFDIPEDTSMFSSLMGSEIIEIQLYKITETYSEIIQIFTDYKKIRSLQNNYTINNGNNFDRNSKLGKTTIYFE